MDDTRFLTDEEITLICARTRKPKIFKFREIVDGFRIYDCTCGYEHSRMFPSLLPDERFENEGRQLVEITNEVALGGSSYD